MCRIMTATSVRDNAYRTHNSLMGFLCTILLCFVLVQQGYADTNGTVIPGRCLLAIRAGFCPREIVKFAFDKNLNDCKQFVFSGCGGNSNLFNSYAICRDVCLEDSIKRGTMDPDCALTPPKGNCTNNEMVGMFSYNMEQGDCFPYKACATETTNSFRYLSDCRAHCLYSVKSPISKPKIKQNCVSKILEGQCIKKARDDQYVFDIPTWRCLKFEDATCYNGDAFVSYYDCKKECHGPMINKTYTPDFVTGSKTSRDCSHVPDTGPCRASFENWYYSESHKTCRKFIYGGCQGTANRFEVAEECMALCAPNIRVTDWKKFYESQTDVPTFYPKRNKRV